jgi:hypothetical protein
MYVARGYTDHVYPQNQPCGYLIAIESDPFLSGRQSADRCLLRSESQRRLWRKQSLRICSPETEKCPKPPHKNSDIKKIRSIHVEKPGTKPFLQNCIFFGNLLGWVVN